MEHPLYRPDLAPVDFFLFGYVKDQSRGRSIAEEEGLFSVFAEPMSEVRPDMILQVFAD
jgi:hypothetical protein